MSRKPPDWGRLSQNQIEEACKSYLDEAAYTMRLRCKRDPLYLGHNVLGKDYSDPAQFHIDTAGAMVRQENFCLQAPRGTGKTVLCNEVGTVFEIIRDPDIRIGLGHGLLERAKAILKAATDHFRHNEMFRALFPEMVPQKASEDPTKTQFICPARRRHAIEPTVMAIAPGSTVTGFHFDLIAVTDLVNEQNVPAPIGKGTVEAMQQVVEFVKTFAALLDVTNPKAREQHNCTRWFDGDAYGYIEQNYPHIRILKYGYHLDANGDPIPIWNRITKETLIQTKLRAGKWLWAANYCQDPLSSETAMFTEDMFIDYDVAPDNLRIAITVDMGYEGKGATSDETAIVVSGVCPLGRLYVLNAVQGHWSAKDAFERIYTLALQYDDIEYIGVESQAYKSMVKDMVFGEIVRGGRLIPYRALEPRGMNKQRRAFPLAWHAETYGIYVRPSMRDGLVHDLCRFPVGERDHFVDALAYRMQDVRPAFTPVTDTRPERRVIDVTKWYLTGEDAIRKMHRGKARGLRLTT